MDTNAGSDSFYYFIFSANQRRQFPQQCHCHSLRRLAYFAIVNFVFGNNTPAAAMSISHWHYGHLLNYNGLAQTIALVFPLLLLFHLWRIRRV